MFYHIPLWKCQCVVGVEDNLAWCAPSQLQKDSNRELIEALAVTKT